MHRIVVGITGASGSIYAVRLIEELYERGAELHIIFSKTGSEVCMFETGIGPDNIIRHLTEKFPEGGNGKILPAVHPDTDLFAPPASGSFRTGAMVVVPCSMATLAGISAGSLRSLLGRSADVCLKERRKMILVPRETPFNRNHLKNMLAADEAGCMIIPAMPGFYSKPSTLIQAVDFVVSRILDALGIENDLAERWQGG